MINVNEIKNSLVSSTYNKLGLGLLTSGIVALLVSLLFGEKMLNIYSHGNMYLVLNLLLIFVLIGVTFFMTKKIAEKDLKAVRNSYYTITVLFGIVLSSIFLIYSVKLIIAAFGITAVLFFVLSKVMIKDTSKLNKWYKFTTIGLIVLIIASFISVVIGNTGFNLLISIFGITIFALFIVFDTNRIIERGKTIDVADVELMSYMYALDLYLDVINIFQYILNILGILDD